MCFWQFKLSVTYIYLPPFLPLPLPSSLQSRSTHGLSPPSPLLGSVKRLIKLLVMTYILTEQIRFEQALLPLHIHFPFPIVSKSGSRKKETF